MLKKSFVLFSFIGALIVSAAIPASFERECTTTKTNFNFFFIITNWYNTVGKSNPAVFDSYASLSNSISAYLDSETGTSLLTANNRINYKDDFKRRVPQLIAVRCGIFIDDAIATMTESDKLNFINSKYAVKIYGSKQNVFNKLVSLKFSNNNFLQYCKSIANYSVDLPADTVIAGVKPIYETWLTKLPLLTDDSNYTNIKKGVSVLGLILKSKGVDVR